MATDQSTLIDGTPVILKVKRSLAIGIFTLGIVKRVVVTVKIKKHGGRRINADRIMLLSQRGTDGAIDQRECTNCHKRKIKWREFGVPQAARITVGARAEVRTRSETIILHTHIGDTELLAPDFR